MRKVTTRVLLTIVVVSFVGALAGFGVYSAFTATTTNTGNAFASGTVSVSQHAGSTTLYSGTNQAPGASTAKCVRVSYLGTLAASLKLYASSGITNGTAFNLKVERGSGLTTLDNTMSCAGFVPASAPYDGVIGSFPTTYVAGIDAKASGAAWAENDTVDYRFTISVVDDSTANARTSAMATGSHTFTWEARSN